MLNLKLINAVWFVFFKIETGLFTIRLVFLKIDIVIIFFLPYDKSKSEFCLLKRPPGLPIELHIGFTPRVFPASFQKHFLVESAELEGVFHPDI